MGYLVEVPVVSGKIAATHSNFPVYIKPSVVTGWGAISLAQAESSRWYTSSARTTELPREVVSADEIYVKVSSLTTTTKIYVDYDGVRADYAASDTYGRNAVWSDYWAVYHFHGSLGSASKKLDSTGNGRNATEGNTPLTGSVTDGQGNANGAYELDGLAGQTSSTTGYDFVQFPTIMSSIGSNDVSFSAVMKYTTQSTVSYSFIRDERSSAEGRPYVGFSINTSDEIIFDFEPTNSGGNPSPALSISRNAWHYVGGRTQSRRAVVRVDGTTSSTGANQKTNSFESGNNGFYLSRRYNTVYSSSLRYMAGEYGEVRLRISDVGNNWQTTEYNNLLDVSGFWGTAVILEEPSAGEFFTFF